MLQIISPPTPHNNEPYAYADRSLYNKGPIQEGAPLVGLKNEQNWRDSSTRVQSKMMPQWRGFMPLLRVQKDGGGGVACLQAFGVCAQMLSGKVNEETQITDTLFHNAWGVVGGGV
jgi:hypothetical protein